MKAKDSWKPVTIGGLTGIMMGAGTMYAIQPKPAHDEEDLSGAESDTADYAHSDVVAANDALSFSEAQADCSLGVETCTAPIMLMSGMQCPTKRKMHLPARHS